MNLLVTGAHGQVGRELVIEATRRRIPHVAFGKQELDIRDPCAVERLTQQPGGAPAIVVNLAAYTRVDAAERDPERAFEVNARGVEILGRRCANIGLPMIHVSTDYVFGGSERDLRETDAPHPLNVYGRSKLAGEEALRDVLREHLILRTSWVFGPHGRNFVSTMLRLAGRETEVRVVADETGCPTSADQVAGAILRMAGRAADSGFGDWGTYHFCGRPAVSRAEFARAIFVAGGHQGSSLCQVREIALAQYGSTASRPKRSVLDCSKIKRVLGVRQPHWESKLVGVVRHLLEIESWSSGSEDP